MDDPGALELRLTLADDGATVTTVEEGFAVI